MKKLHFLIVAFVFSALVSGMTHAQSSNDSKAKAYFFSAQEYFEAKDYVNALNYLQSAQNLLGKGNAQIEALRAKTLHHKGDVAGAKRSLDRFFRYSPNASLTREMAAYTREIESRYEANKTRAAADRRAKAEKDRQARIAADKRAREQAAKAQYDQQRKSNASKQTRRLRGQIADASKECNTAEECLELSTQLLATSEQMDKDIVTFVRANPGVSHQHLVHELFDHREKERVIAEKSCSLGSGAGCINFSQAILWGVRIGFRVYSERSDAIKAQAELLTGIPCPIDSLFSNCAFKIREVYLDKGCALKHFAACQEWQWMYANKRMKAVKGTKLYDAAAKGCGFGDKDSCWRLEYDLKQAAGRKWTNEAIKYADLACKYGREDSCKGLARSNRYGMSNMKKNKKLARAYINKFCAIEGLSEKQCKKEYRKL